VITPVLASPLHLLADDERHERDEAEARLQATLESLARTGVQVEGVVGADDPLQAVGDALAGFQADEVLLVGPLPSGRDWLEQGFEKRVRDLYGVPVATVFACETRERLTSGEPRSRPDRRRPGRAGEAEPTGGLRTFAWGDLTRRTATAFSANSIGGDPDVVAAHDADACCEERR